LLVSLFGNGLEKVVFVIGILSWPPIARITRAQFLSLKELEFVEAARSQVISTRTIIISEILPNALPPAIVAGSLQVARAILLEAGLSFLGLGDPELISWGTMLNTAQPFLRTAGWMTIWPGMAISIVVLGFNLMGDGLNDAMNPRSEQR
jgi:peptide/nickel transport system permease protein